MGVLPGGKLGRSLFYVYKFVGRHDNYSGGTIILRISEAYFLSRAAHHRLEKPQFTNKSLYLKCTSLPDYLIEIQKSVYTAVIDYSWKFVHSLKQVITSCCHLLTKWTPDFEERWYINSICYQLNILVYDSTGMKS